MLAVQNLEPGTRIKLNDGRVVEVLENPRDGTWLIVREAETGALEELCHVDDILELA
jgi:hypothetical protein